MASTNKTSNLELSQFIATDTPTWLVDYNGDMEKIDAGVGRVEELAETASTQAVGVASGLQATNQTVTTLSGQVANVQNQANTTTASVNGIFIKTHIIGCIHIFNIIIIRYFTAIHKYSIIIRIK